MNRKTAFIFPAFITNFTGKEIDFLKENSIDINSYLQKISNIINIDLPEFTYDSEYYKNSELNSQLLAYAFSCTISDIIKKKGVKTDYIAGYSMGIYAALYAAESISFEAGVKLIFKAYNILSDITETKVYGMGAIIGLPVMDIEYIIKENAPDTEIINVNNEHSLVIAGKKTDIDIILEKATDEGAMSTFRLIVDTPYHSKHLIKYSDTLKEYINTLSINKAKIPLISTYDQRMFIKESDIKSELLYNLTSNINWFKTMMKLIKSEVGEFYECGAGKDLKKISRFIKGDYKMNSIYRI